MYASDVLFEVKKKDVLAPQVFSLGLEAKVKMGFVPGQCVQVAVPNPSDPTRFLSLYFSIASPPESDIVELCIKDTGGPSHYLTSLEPGATVRLRGPMGEFRFAPVAGRNLCFVGGGTGIAPLRSMVLSAAFRQANPRRTWFLHAVRGEQDPLYHQELSQLPKVEWTVAYSQAKQVPKGSFQGRVTDYLKGLGEEFPWRDTEFYLCGSAPLVLDVKQLLEKNSVPASAIHHEAHVTASLKRA